MTLPIKKQITIPTIRRIKDLPKYLTATSLSNIITSFLWKIKTAM